jgi:asparagine synthase (glutamine-hydrolysing)
MDHYWGRYVAFLHRPVESEYHIVRDPTGALVCLLTTISGITVFMSDLVDFINLDTHRRSVNWNHVSSMFWNMRLVTRETGFDGVSQVYAGECLTISGDSRSGTFHWNPVRVYEREQMQDPVQAGSTLKSTIEYCVRSWAAGYSDILHQLSGGLDSSIVAACLTTPFSNANVTCLNMHTETEEGDERRFARQVATQCGFPLIEGQWHSAVYSLENLLDSSGIQATPSMAVLHSEKDFLLQRLASEHTAQAVFSGQGGDHLFQQRRSPLIAADAVWDHGLSARLATIIRDTSRLTQTSIWSVSAHAITFGLLRRRIDPYSRYKYSSLLTDDARAAISVDALRHPWLLADNVIPPAKVDQIYNIVDLQHFYLRAPCRYADVIHPLLSQPIVECCLRIPTYVLARGGVSRSLVREVFRPKLPSEIAARTAKGGTTSYFNRLAVENAEFLREYLLNGSLVAQGILRRDQLESQLSHQALVRGELIFDVITAARVEAWLQGWQSSWRRNASVASDACLG